jgi:4-amino-4-deoxy-L-arabinose transferase-like glycosyltransferase
MKQFFEKWKNSVQEATELNAVSTTAQKISLALILLLCFAIRIWTIGSPALDRTHWKEIDYLMVSSNYWANGYDFVHPEISWPAEPPRVTAMELPLVPFVAGLTYKIIGFNAYSVRLITLFAFLLITVYVFRLVKRELGPLAGLIAAMASAIMPLYHMFGKILFSEPLMIALSVMSLFHYAEWVDYQKRRDWFLAMASFSLAVALKLEPLFLLLPLLWTAFRSYRWEIGRYRSFILLVGCAFILPVAWYSYAFYLANHFLDVFGVFGGKAFGGHDKFQTLTMLSDPAWYKTMIGRIGGNILGGKIGALLCLAGVIVAFRLKKTNLFFAYLLSVGMYFGIVAEGQIDAPYRQLNAIPPLSMFVGLGAIGIVAFGASWLDSFKGILVNTPWRVKISLVLCVVLILAIGIRNHKLVFKRDSSVPAWGEKWELAQEIKKHADVNSKLVTVGEYTIHVGGYDLSPVLYYYSGLQGWTLQKGEWEIQRVQSLVKKGATHFTAFQMSREPEAAPFLREMKAHYRILYEDEEKFLLDLK